MPEFFIVTTSFAAPFFSDTDHYYQEADTPEQAVELLAQRYGHPAGLYAAQAFVNADAFHKNEPHLAQWLCNHEQAKRRLVPSTSGYSYLGLEPGRFEIDGVLHEVPEPKGGCVVVDTEACARRLETDE